jgi:alpha-methylacyl-CoA racemase
MGNSERTKLLNGVRVLDLCQYVPGPYASLKMLELGAEIIKIEPPGGDPFRKFGDDFDDFSPLYQHLNRGKKIVELDLKSETGRLQLSKLVGSANVLIEGFRPGTLGRLGFSFKALHAINPKLVICSLSGFGQNGENAHRAGHDLGYAACSGLYTQQAMNGKPRIVYPLVADHTAALKALNLVCAALYCLEKTGLGCVLDVSISGAVADWQYMFEHASLSRHFSGDLACYNIYQTSDGAYITLGALEPKFWKKFCIFVERPEWVSRQNEKLPQYNLIKELQALFMERALGEWKAKFRDVDCCFEAISTRDEVLIMAEANRQASNQVLPDLQCIDAKDIHWSKV